MKKTLFAFSAFFATLTSTAFAYYEELADLKYRANRGETDALVALGECYERGDGVPADQAVALSYYLVAFKKDKSNEDLQARIAALGGTRFLSETGAAVPSGKTYVVDLGNGTKLELAEIPAGMFFMGSREDFLDEKQVRVKISELFFLGKTEITQAQWSAAFEKNPSFFKKASLPVECVTWHEAMAFCEKLTARERRAGRLPKGMKFSLPTEEQWEYACRAGTQTRFCSGETENDLSRVAWWKENSGETTHAPAQKEPNAWGLYDMHGNVWEWCANFARRGGGWNGTAKDCRAADSYRIVPVTRSRGIGFRVALVKDE
ncbi:MAG: SUMF1/EgtB/PvdO family nonheme iron enzyme [Opitutales bacterium]|nr:SUMF1/EgtB/PvdO family nonheme iron enzyme [Opitutales bacterium]